MCCVLYLEASTTLLCEHAGPGHQLAHQPQPGCARAPAALQVVSGFSPATVSFPFCFSVSLEGVGVLVGGLVSAGESQCCCCHPSCHATSSQWPPLAPLCPGVHTHLLKSAQAGTGLHLLRNIMSPSQARPSTRLAWTASAPLTWVYTYTSDLDLRQHP